MMGSRAQDSRNVLLALLYALFRAFHRFVQIHTEIVFLLILFENARSVVHSICLSRIDIHAGRIQHITVQILSAIFARSCIAIFL